MSGMSTGQVVGGIVGAVIGYFVPGSYVFLGAQLGMLAGGAIDPGKGPNTSGPRLADLTVQTSTYGAVIPRLYGTQAFTGNVFWLEGNAIKETPVKKKTGGKGGKPKSTQTTWVNTATFAVGLCKGPIVGIRRIWIKGELFYDAGSTDPSTVAASNAAAEGFEVYLGTNTQMPDPRIQADLGAANTPAWRGLAYIVFYDLNLAKYGETLMGAQVKVEVVKSGNLDDYAASYGSFTNTRDWSYQSPTSWSGSAFLSLAGGAAIGATSPDGLVWTEHALPVAATWRGNAYGAGVFVIGSSDANQYLYTSPDGVTWSSIWLGGPSYSIQSIVWNGAMFLATTYWQDFLTSTNGVTWTPRTHPRTNNFAFCAWNGTRWVATCETLGVVVWSEDGISWTEQAMPGTGFDRIAANGATFCAFRNSDRHVAISTDGVTWTEYAATGISTAIETLTSANGIFVVGALANKFWTSADGVAWTSHALAITKAWHGACFDGVGISMVDASLAQCVYIRMNLLDIVDPGLDTVVLSECVSSGLLTAPDVDVSALSSTTVRGYLIGSQGSIRTSLEPLRASWPFDVLQHGYQLKFIPRGGSAVATIDADDLDAHNVSGKPGVQITTTREMDSQLPRVLKIKHSDYAREYEVGEQYAERLITDAINDETIDLPIVMTSAEAAGKAETLLHLRWLERFDIAFTLPATYNNLEPTDVVTLQTPEGDVSVRLTSINYTSDGRLECKGKYNSSAVYVPASVGSTPLVTGASTLPSPGPSSYVMLDVPYMHTAQADPSFLVSMWGADGWPGGVLMRTDDAGTTWNEVQAFTSPGGTSGTASNTIGSVDSRVWDKSSRLSVTLQAGDVFDATELAVLNGANHFAYGAHGRWEIIAVQKCTLVSGSSYTFSDMLRGRFGTEWAMTTHAVGDKVVALTSSEVTTIGMSAATIGLERTYRGVTYDQDISTATDYAFTYNGVNLECLSPVYFNGYNAVGSTDWTLTWVRRSRTDGEWRDLVDAGLGETTEAYEVDIFSDGTYTTVKRTLTATSPTCTYTTADQTTDFGSVQTTIYAKVYQMSSVVGRGYPTTATFTA